MSEPVVFQDKQGNIFFVEDKVRPIARMDIKISSIPMLVDADDQHFQPNVTFLASFHGQVLLTSSPKDESSRRWLTQDVKNRNAVFMMNTWSPKELYVTTFVESTSLILPLMHFVGSL
jgi:hypothetical protein